MVTEKKVFLPFNVLSRAVEQQPELEYWRTCAPVIWKHPGWNSVDLSGPKYMNGLLVSREEIINAFGDAATFERNETGEEVLTEVRYG